MEEAINKEVHYKTRKVIMKKSLLLKGDES